ncbi:toxin glutamine deamidase domain-containing protein [Saccharopolyspora pogona]|uniref:toxin glutamine deamidase domain-containing protein n=1 Tax=Saccharopolyspora pogona TaxID=333966 RepID=UPI001689070D|nr:toxin glutamine deamidase domain-containing protein [Saccharopolyspora pogona]
MSAPIRPQENTRAVTGGDDFAGFLGGYSDDYGVGSVGLSDGGSFGEPFPADAVSPNAMGSGYRFLRGVNQANYRSGDERFRVNCLEAVVAFHNSLKFGRQFVAGPAGDRDPARLEVAFGAKARWVGGVAGAEQYVRSMQVGVAVPVIYQRGDGSAHVIAAVHGEDRDEQGRVVLLDPQKGEEVEDADVLAATGMWVIPVSVSVSVPVPGVGVEVDGEVVLPPGGSRWRGRDGGSGLPTVVTGPKRRGGVSGPVAEGAGAVVGESSRGVKRRKVGESSRGVKRRKVGESSRGVKRRKVGESSRGVKRRKVDASAAAGAVSGSPGDGGSEVLTPTDQAAQQDPSAKRKRKQKANNAKQYQARKAAAARVAELEGLARPLTEGQAAELAKLQPKVAQLKQKKKADNAKYRRVGKAAADRVAVLEGLKEQGQLTDEQEAELAELQPKVAQLKQKKKEWDVDWYRVGKAAADRVAVLERLKEQGQLTDEQEAELAELQPKAQQWQKKKERDVDWYRVRKAAADRVAVLEGLKGQGRLTDEQAAELAELQRKAQQWQKQKEKNAKYRRVGKAAADRVAELETLKKQGPLTDEQKAELAELQPKVAQLKQKKKEYNANRYQVGKAAADRVAELETLKKQGPLTDEQKAELAELQPKVAQLKQKKKEYNANRYQVGKAAAARVAVLEGLEGRGRLAEGQGVELAELRSTVAGWQKQKERWTDWYQAGKAAADRVAELETLKERGRLTEGQGAELRPKAQRWQKKKERWTDWYRARKAAARVAVLEGLEGRGRLAEGQGVELAELRSTVAGWGRKKKVGEVTETGVGGALVVGRGVGPEGVSGWTGTEHDRDAWWADVDLDAWLARAVADVDGARVPQGAADAGVMLGEGAYEEFVATELLAFLGQDAGDDAAGADSAGPVARGDDFAGFLPDYHDGEGSVGWFGGEGTDGLFFGEPFPEDPVWPDAVGSGVWGVSDPVAGGESMGSGYRFLRGVNQANYRCGDERFRVNCLEAVVAFHNSLKFGRQFVAGPAGDRDPARLEEAFGAKARRVDGVAGAEQYVRGGPVGVAVPVIYQRADGSAHVIAAVHGEDRDEQGRVVLLDPQKGEEAEDADVLAATGMWVIPVPVPVPVPGAEVDGDGEVVLPPSGSGLRRRDGGSGLPAVVTGPKRRGGASGPVAGAKGTKRTRGEAGESSRGVKRRKVEASTAAAAAGAVSGSPGDGGSEVLTPTDQAAQQDPSAERKRKQREYNAKQYRAKTAAVARVAELEGLKTQRTLTSDEEKELAELRPKAQQLQKQKKDNAERYRAKTAAADRVAVLEELKKQGPLTSDEEKELKKLRPKVAQLKQKQKESATKYRRAGQAAADRVAVLEASKEQGPLTDEQEKELAELRPKAQQWQKVKERVADRYRVGKAAAARVAVLEASKKQGPLTDEEEKELAELRPKAQQWQKQKERAADWYRVGKAAAARVAVLEASKKQGPLTSDEEKELKKLQPKVAQLKQKQKESATKYRRAGQAAADRVAVLEASKKQGPLTDEEEKELAELRPKAQQWQKQKERFVDWRRVGKAAAARVAVLEASKKEGPLTDEQEKELAALRSKVAGRGRKKKDREVTETGVGGAPVVGRGVGPEGVSGWTGADQDGRDAWSAEVDLDAWLAGAVADVDGARVPQGVADAGVMLGGDVYEEFVATELLGFLGQDAGDESAGADSAGSVAGDDDFAAFLDEYGGDSVGWFGGEGTDGLFFGEPFPEDAEWPDEGR